MLVEIALLGCVVAVAAALVAYSLARYTARRYAGRWDQDAYAAALLAADAPALIGASGPGAGQHAASPAPLDDWVDDTLRRELDAL
jgi:hypothetical protein